MDVARCSAPNRRRRPATARANRQQARQGPAGIVREAEGDPEHGSGRPVTAIAATATAAVDSTGHGVLEDKEKDTSFSMIDGVAEAAHGVRYSTELANISSQNDLLLA